MGAERHRRFQDKRIGFEEFESGQVNVTGEVLGSGFTQRSGPLFKEVEDVLPPVRVPPVLGDEAVSVVTAVHLGTSLRCEGQ